jgi:hypothetical protein
MRRWYTRYTPAAAMDKLKLYAAPLIALVLLLAWYFVVRPKLADEPVAEDPAAKTAE